MSPLGLHINTDVRVVPVDMNVTTEEFEVAWGLLWGFPNFTHLGLGEASDAERCFVCCCRPRTTNATLPYPPPSNVTNVTNAMPVCNLAPDPVLPSEEDEGLECHRTDLGVICVNSSSASNASVVGKRCQSCMFYLRVLYS